MIDIIILYKLKKNLKRNYFKKLKKIKLNHKILFKIKIIIN